MENEVKCFKKELDKGKAANKEVNHLLSMKEKEIVQLFDLRDKTENKVIELKTELEKQIKNNKVQSEEYQKIIEEKEKEIEKPLDEKLKNENDFRVLKMELSTERQTRLDKTKKYEKRNNEMVKEIESLIYENNKLEIKQVESALNIKKKLKIDFLSPGMIRNRERIGEGGFGTVFSATVNGKRIAVKVVAIVRKDKGTEVWDPSSINDLALMLRINGDNLVHASHFGFDWQHSLQHCNILIGMDLMESDLKKFVTERADNRDESWKPNILFQTSLAVEQLHCLPVMHRDIKLENFLVKGRVVKLCDYGISMPGMWSSGPSGTPGYMAPEVSSGQPYNLKVDIFSLACVHHKILTGRSLIPDTLNQIPRWHETTKLMSRSLLFCSLILFFYIFFAGLLNCQC